MDIVLLLLLAASGLCAVSARVYHFSHQQKNWTEAQSYCREKYTDLATINSTKTVKLLTDLAENRSISSAFWIGLYDDVDSWRWSLSDSSFYKHGETEFRHWEPGQPENFRSDEHCVGISGGQFFDAHCWWTIRSVCMDVRGQNVTFNLISTPMNWTDAQSYCRKHHTDLASVRNMADNQKVTVVAAGQRSWIGLYRDSWKWSDGSNLSFTFWSNGQPNGGRESCALADFSQSGRWEDSTCDTKRGFICYSQSAPTKEKVPVTTEKVPVTTEKVPVTTKQVIKVRLHRKGSSVDPNDPAVMQQILEEFQQKLKDQGLNEGVRLSWRKQPDGKVFHKEKEKKDEL